MMKIIGYIILVIIVLLGLTFACLNADPVTINYYVGQNQLPLSLLLIISFTTGGVLGLLSSTLLIIKMKAEIVRTEHRLKTSEKELANLRNIPLQDAH